MNRIKAKEILDSNGRATIEVWLKTEEGLFKASVPSGISAGRYEAAELRDEDGGVKKALDGIEKNIAPALEKEDISSQKRIDEILIKLDGSKNKSRLGANAILAVSVACCRAGAKARKLPLYKYINQISNIKSQESNFPQPSFNMIEGGAHSAAQGLALQEFMIIPQKKRFKENYEIGKKTRQNLKKFLERKFGKKNVLVSKEGAFSPPIKKVFEALELILASVKDKNNIKIAIDSAASQFHKDGVYAVDGQFYSTGELASLYFDLMKKYPIVSIEDPFAEDDEAGWKAMESDLLIFGDDLTTTNLERIEMAKRNKLCNGVIIKPNQIGTVTEALEAAKLAKSFHWKIMVANRAGETKDDFIADLAVGIGADFIKSGAPFPKERMAKYNRLIEIEKEIKRCI